MRFVSDDRVVDPKSNSLRVLAAGLPRCATSSIQAALESDVLGLAPCMHMAHIVPHPDRAQLTIDAMREANREARQKILHQIFDGYAASADFPGMMFVDDLLDMYPEAVVILNKRKSAKVWAESIQNSLRFFGTRSYLLPCLLWKTDRLHYKIHQESYKLWERRFGTPDIFTERSYDLHNEWVRAEAKKRGRPVLEYQPGEGWEPICNFLRKPPPQDGRPFPHLNDAADLRMLKRILVIRGLFAWAALGGTIWAGWTYGPRLLTVAIDLITKYGS